MGVSWDKKSAKRAGRATMIVEAMNLTQGTSWYRRRFPRGNSSTTVIITATIAAASWSSGTSKLTPTIDEENTFAWTPHVDDDGTFTYDDTKPIKVQNWFTSAITVTSGKGKIAQVVNGRIFNVDCNEISLGE